MGSERVFAESMEAAQGRHLRELIALVSGLVFGIGLGAAAIFAVAMLAGMLLHDRVFSAR